MRRAVVDANGRLDLGDDARRARYIPGAVVEISVNCTGTLMIRLADDDSCAVDVYARRLPATRTPALMDGRMAG